MRFLIILITTSLSVYYLNCHENTVGSDKSSLGNLLFPDAKNIGIANDIILSNGTDPTSYLVDPYRIENVSLDRDSIRFTVKYSGGCKAHDFSLVAYNYFLESNPVQVNILLEHDSNKDACEALITKDNMSFSLEPLKNEYIKAYGNQGRMILNLMLNGKSQKKDYKL